MKTKISHHAGLANKFLNDFFLFDECRKFSHGKVWTINLARAIRNSIVLEAYNFPQL